MIGVFPSFCWLKTVDCFAFYGLPIFNLHQSRLFLLQLLMRKETKFFFIFLRMCVTGSYYVLLFIKLIDVPMCQYGVYFCWLYISKHNIAFRVHITCNALKKYSKTLEKKIRMILALILKAITEVYDNDKKNKAYQRHSNTRNRCMYLQYKDFVDNKEYHFFQRCFLVCKPDPK